MSNDVATIEAVSNALETMAFVSAWPCEVDPAEDAPVDPVLASIEYQGAEKGTLELVAPRAFARMLAANLLGSTDPNSPSDAEASDALKELMNVACGAILRARRATESTRFDMTIPGIEDLDPVAGWSEFTARAGVVVLDADGSRIAFRVVEGHTG